jgi:uncharacterized protein
LNAYLDASVLVTMFTVDDHRQRLSGWLAVTTGRLTLSDWTLTEFTSALAVARRVGRLNQAECDAAEAALQLWMDREPPALAVDAADIRAARRSIKSTALPLRAGDALHLSIARRVGCSIATFDNAMRRAAMDLGVPVEDL